MLHQKLPRVVTVAFVVAIGLAGGMTVASHAGTNEFVRDSQQVLERTCFQTSQAYSDAINVRSDVAIVYGIDAGLPARLQTWRDHGYRLHVMTGVSWGGYQDYLYGRFDGTNHEDEAQTDRQGKKISHGGDIYYMCPGENFGKFLSIGVQRALDAGVEAIHLEEPEFWVRGGYSEGFKREWSKFYGEEWQPPHASPDAQWRASKLKYYLYRRALQQVFDHVQAFNRRTGRQVRCYVPTHSLLSYAHWRIVSPESSLAGLQGCDGYIAQVWTGTARTPNRYRGSVRERTFETAFLEYGAMQNLVRATGRGVWYLNDPVEDDPNHDWGDYQRNWESTLVASLLQPDVWQYEVMPWPERIFRGRYPSAADHQKRVSIPGGYATEIQTVINALNDLNQKVVRWDNPSASIGVVVSDSLMFQRGEPVSGDRHLGEVYGLALPLVKRGIPIEPVQLENIRLGGYLKRYSILLASYHGQKPLTPEVHSGLAAWVRQGGVLVFVDDDTDPYAEVREWWNTGDLHYRTPREHLFVQMGLARDTGPGQYPVGQGILAFQAADPVAMGADRAGDMKLMAVLREAMAGRPLAFHEQNYFLLQRGKYQIAAGLDESTTNATKALQGQFINLFDPELRLQSSIVLAPGSRFFLLDVGQARGNEPEVLAAACKILSGPATPEKWTCQVEGVINTKAVILLRSPASPRAVTLDGKPLEILRADAANRLLWLEFPNQPFRRELSLLF